MPKRSLMLPNVAIGFAQREPKMYPFFRREGCRFRRQLFHRCKRGIAWGKSLHRRQAEIETGFLRGECRRFFVGMACLCEVAECPQNATEVVVCRRETRLEDQSLLKLRNRLVQSALFLQRSSELAVCLRIHWAQDQRLLIAGHRLVQLALFSQRVAEIGVGRCRARIESRSPSKL